MMTGGAMLGGRMLGGRMRGGVFAMSAAMLAAGCCTGSKCSYVDFTLAEGLSTPESALHDSASDLYLVSNIHGSPFGDDGQAGYISRIRPDGTVENLRWIDGATEGVELNAPKGLGVLEDTLYVADVTAVRKFDRNTGAPKGSVPIDGATFLNDIAVGSDGLVYVSDTGLGPGFSETGTDADLLDFVGRSGQDRRAWNGFSRCRTGCCRMVTIYSS